jgi:hypothetical protein
VRLRTITLIAIGAVLVAGCGSADRSGQPGGATSASADAGPAAAYAPPESLVYLHADKTSVGWKQLAPQRDALEKIQNYSGGLNMLAWAFSGLWLQPQKEIRAATSGGESAFIIIANDKATDPAVDGWRYLAYDTVSDRAALERELAKGWNRSGDDGDFALYTSKSGGDVTALSEKVTLSATTMADLRGAIARGTAGGPSLAGDPDFVAALARDHDADAVIRGYSRGDLAGALDPNAGGDQGGSSDMLGATTALGLAKTSFDAGLSAKGIWVHAHPATTAGGYPAATPFQPTLLKRVPRGAIVYVGLSDMGDQLAQLARLVDTGGSAFGTAQTSATVPGRFAVRVGIDVAQMTPFLHGEQAWWWGRSTGAAFRPSDPDAAYATAQQVARHFAAEEGSALQGMKASRDGDIVTVNETYLDPDKPPPADPDATLTDDAGFDDLLRDAELPDKVSALVYGDPRSFHPQPGDDASEKTAFDSLGRMLLWSVPVDGGYDLDYYAELTAAP